MSNSKRRQMHLSSAFATVNHLVDGMTDAQARYLGCLTENFDQETGTMPKEQTQYLHRIESYMDFKRMFDDNPNAEYPYDSILGAHMMYSKADIARKWGKRPHTITGWFKVWEQSGWVANAKNVHRLDKDVIHAQFTRSQIIDPVAKHYVFNVSKLCRLLDVKDTLDHHFWYMSNEEQKPLIDFALKTFDDDFDNQTTYDLVTYRPNIINDWSMIGSSEYISTWDDLLSMQTHL